MTWDEPIQERCLSCGEVLFEKALLRDEGHPTELILASDGVDYFYECPHCGAKNVVVEERNSYGIPVSRISHIKK